MISTVGTNTEEILSASRPIAGLLDCARRTISIMRASAVSAPMRLAWNRKVPAVLSVPPVTSSPTFFPTGIGSPVSMDSSTLEWPSMITPSTGIFSPGRTRRVSLSPTSAMGISISRPSRMTRAVLGCKPIRALDCFRGLTAGAHFERLTEIDKRDDNSRGLEIGVARIFPARCPGTRPPTPSTPRRRQCRAR